MRGLTNVPASSKGATSLMRLYRARWTIESRFQRLESVLESGIRSLGSPCGALLGFCVALLAYNVLALLQACVEGTHPICETEPISCFYIAAEVREAYRGLRVAIPAEYWTPYERYSDAELAALRVTWAARVHPATVRKHPRKERPKRKKKYRPASEVRRQVATARVLAAGTLNYAEKTG